MKKKLFLMLLCAGYLSGYAQKESKELVQIQVSIAPLMAPPEKPVTYLSIVETKANVSAAKTEAWVKEDLVISGYNYRVVAVSPDWIVKLKTSPVKITSRNEKPVNELTDDDYLAKYIYEASLIVTDAANKVVYQADLPESGKEQEFPKLFLWADPTYKVRLAMVKNNPVKTKAIVDEVLGSIDGLILSMVADKAGKQLNDVFAEAQKPVNQMLYGVKGKGYDEINTINEKFLAVYGKFRAMSKKNRVPKEEVDNVLREALPIWEKYIANNNELEEKAKKGLILNCAFASTWLGEYAKASDYLSKVPEAKKNDGVEGPGASSIMTFSQSAETSFYFNQVMQDYKGRAAIVQ